MSAAIEINGHRKEASTFVVPRKNNLKLLEGGQTEDPTVSDHADTAKSALDLLRKVVPDKILSGAKRVQKVGTNNARVWFGEDEDTKLVVNLSNDGETAPRVFLVEDPKHNPHVRSLENHSTMFENPVIEKDGRKTFSAVVFVPPSKDDHQVILTSTGATTLKKATEMQNGNVQLTEVSRTIYQKMSREKD